MADEKTGNKLPEGGDDGTAEKPGVHANAASWTGRNDGATPYASRHRYPPFERFVQPMLPDAPLTPHQFYPRVKFMGKMPRILISPEAYKRMQLYVELARLEVGWLGTAERLESGDYFIEHVFLLRQTAGAAHARISVEGQTELYTDLMRAGRREDTRRLLFWGHSHVRMDTAPSPQDDATMVELKEQRNKWFIRGILNKLGRATFDLYLFEQDMYLVDVPWEIWSPKPIEADEPKTGLAAVTEGLSSLKKKVVKGTKRLLESLSNDPVSKPEKQLKGPLSISDELRQEVEAEIRDKVTITYLPSFERFGGDFPYFPGAEDVAGQGAQPEGSGERDTNRPAGESTNAGDTGETGDASVFPDGSRHLPGPPESLPPSTTGGGTVKTAAFGDHPTSNAPGAKGE